MATQAQYDIGAEMTAYCDLRTSAHAEFEKASQVYANLVAQNNKALAGDLRPGGLDQQTKILVLLAMHIASGSRQSVEFAASAALQAGAKREQIMDAIDLALLTRGGQAVANAQFAFEIIKADLSGLSAAGRKPDRFEFLSREALGRTTTGKK